MINWMKTNLWAVIIAAVAGLLGLLKLKTDRIAELESDAAFRKTENKINNQRNKVEKAREKYLNDQSNLAALERKYREKYGDDPSGGPTTK